MVRTALITGSTDPNGIGFTAAFLLASQHDHNVILTGRDPSATNAAAAELNKRLLAAPSHKSKVYPLPMDVTNSESIARAVAELSEKSGVLAASNGALDVLINNAGVGAPPGRGGKGTSTMFLQTELTKAEDVMHVMATNVAAVVEVTNAFIPLLAKSSAPRIVNVSSARGSLSFASGLDPSRTGALVYNTSKAALNMVTVMQAKNLPALIGANLKVNAASPGHVKTPFNNFTGIRTVEEGAGVYVHLSTLSDEGPTGQLIGNHAPFSTDDSFVQIPW